MRVLSSFSLSSLLSILAFRVFLTNTSIYVYAHYYIWKETFTPAIPRDAITKRLLSWRMRILLGFENRSTSSTIASSSLRSMRRCSSWNGSPAGILLGPGDKRDRRCHTSSFASVDCPPRCALIPDSSGAFRGNTFVWGPLCGLRREPRARPEAIRTEGGFEFHSPPPFTCPIPHLFVRYFVLRSPPRPHLKSLSFRRVEGAVQRRFDLHRLVRKVDPGFTSFENARATLRRQLYVNPERYFWHASFGYGIWHSENDSR